MNIFLVKDGLIKKPDDEPELRYNSIGSSIEKHLRSSP